MLYRVGSQDGSKIVFYSYRDGGFNTPKHIFVMNADGEGRRNLTGDTHLTSNWFPTWSPDGRKIAFYSQRHFPDRTRDDIFAITADGKELEQLTEDGRSRSPVYSPDGTKIAYVSHRNGDSHIYLMEANGMNAVKLTRTPPGTDNISPSWPHGALAVTRNGKLPISWGKISNAPATRDAANEFDTRRLNTSLPGFRQYARNGKPEKGEDDR